MKTWFTSLNGAIALSTIALLSLLARTFVDFQFVFTEFASSPGQAALAVLIMTALFGSWFWGLLVAVRGSRRGLMVVLILTLLLPFGEGIATLISFCPSPCPTAWPLMEIANWSNVILGLVAALAVGLHLRQARPA